MNQWLADFAYRIDIGLGIFLLAGGAAFSIALLSVSWQSIKAAVANPVESLRSEWLIAENLKLCLKTTLKSPFEICGDKKPIVLSIL